MFRSHPAKGKRILEPILSCVTSCLAATATTKLGRLWLPQGCAPMNPAHRRIVL